TVEKFSLPLDDTVTDGEVETASKLLQLRFADRTIPAIAGVTEEPAVVAGPAEADGTAVASLVQSCRDILRDRTSTEDPGDQVYVGGAARMAENFAAVEQVRAVLTILEASFVVVSLLRD